MKTDFYRMPIPLHLTKLAMLMVLAPILAFAQSPPPLDPAREQALSQRFQQGKALEQSGDIAGARAVFEKIIADEPSARGSLREAGILALSAGDLKLADTHFEALHKLEPKYPAAYEYLIQINQALGRDIKVIRLIKEFKELHAAGVSDFPDFGTSTLFVRERTTAPSGNKLIISEFFDYTQPPYTVWMAEEITPDLKLAHRLLLNYDPQATAELRAKDPRLAKAEEFLLMEQVINEGKIVSIDVYQQLFIKPDYAKVKSAMVNILAKHPKPIMSSKVPN